MMNSSTFEIPNNIVPSNSDNNGSTQNISFCKNGLKEICLLPPEQAKLFSPLERIVLMANGNLQRIISSYYNSEVQVSILKFDKIQNDSISTSTYHREVSITCLNQEFCYATSEIVISDNSIQHLIESGKIGIGQLFNHLGILPVFTLLHYGKDELKFWREYTLEAKGILCRIFESFPSNLFDLKKKN